MFWSLSPEFTHSNLVSQKTRECFVVLRFSKLNSKIEGIDQAGFRDNSLFEFE